jgi:hypothetical protein
MSEYMPFFIGWPLVITGVLAIKAINYYFKNKDKPIVQSQKIEDLPSLKDIGFASGKVFVYNGKAYWMENDKLHCAKHQDVVHVDTKSMVDPINHKDLSIEEYMSVLEQVESMTK